MINEVKVNKSRYIALFVVSGSIKKVFLIDLVNPYLFSIVFSIAFARWKTVGLLLISYVVIHELLPIPTGCCVKNDCSSLKKLFRRCTWISWVSQCC